MLRSVSMPGVCDAPFSPRRRLDGVAGVEQDGAALLHIGVERFSVSCDGFGAPGTTGQ